MVVLNVFMKINLALSKPKLLDLMRVPLLKNEEQILIDYCENGSEFCRDFLLNYYIHRGRYSEALKTHQILFGGRNLNLKDQKRQSLMNNVMLLLPPVLRTQFSLPVPKVMVSDAVTTLSQSSFIRGKHINEEQVLNALRANYVNEEQGLKADYVNEDTGVIDVSFEGQSVTNSFGTETAALPSTLVETKSLPNTPRTKAQVVKESSPFLQPPYTPQALPSAT
jgi:hypothetical protein